jgi:hypothetical protein
MDGTTDTAEGQVKSEEQGRPDEQSSAEPEGEAREEAVQAENAKSPSGDFIRNCRVFGA